MELHQETHSHNKNSAGASDNGSSKTLLGDAHFFSSPPGCSMAKMTNLPENSQNEIQRVAKNLGPSSPDW